MKNKIQLVLSIFFAKLIRTLGLKFYILNRILNKNEKNLLVFYNTQSPSYLIDVGWFDSLEKKMCININGEYMPWISYPMYEFLDNRIKEDFVVFEYGMGASTYYWVKKVKTIVSVDNDLAWYNEVKNKNQKSILHYMKIETGNDYVNSISLDNLLYDIIFIDGRKRLECVYKSIKFLTKRGVVILDNSDRDKYAKAFDFFNKKGFRELTIGGLVVSHYMKSSTTIFYKNDNCLKI